MTYINQLTSAWSSYRTLRFIEKDFSDFRSYSYQKDFKFIYHDLYRAYKNRDKVILKSSLSQDMYTETVSLINDKFDTFPFLKTVN